MVNITDTTLPNIGAPQVPNFVADIQNWGNTLTDRVQNLGSGGDTMFLGYVIIFFSGIMFLSLIGMLIRARIEEIHG